MNIEDTKGHPGDIIFSPSSPIHETSLYFRMVQRIVKQPADVKDLTGPEGGGGGLLADPGR